MLRKIIAVMLILIISVPFCFVEGASENLVPNADSAMEQTNSWEIFGTGKVGVQQVITKDGKSENVLRAVDLGSDTWSTPAYDVFKIIKTDIEKNGAGRYAIFFNFMLEGSEGKEYNLNYLVRASSKNELFKNGDGGVAGFRTSLGQIKAVSGKWKSFTTSIGIKKEFVQGDEKWLLCFDSLPKDLTSIWIDDFTIIRLSDDTTPEIKNIMCIDSAKYGDGTVQGSDGKTESVEEGVNLLAENTSTFNNIKTWQESGWQGLSAGNMTITEEGYNGSALKMETPKNTWGSPALDIFPYIKEPGKYSISMMVKYDGDGEKKLNLILRGSRKNSFIEQHNSNFYGDIGTKRVEAGKWVRMTATFTVEKEDLVKSDSWRLCFSSIAADVKALYIDEVVLVKGGVKDLPDVAEPNESVRLEQEMKEKEQIQPLYDENIKKTAITTAIRTLIVVAIVIPLKIFLPKVFKKGAKK